MRLNFLLWGTFATDCEEQGMRLTGTHRFIILLPAVTSAFDGRANFMLTTNVSHFLLPSPCVCVCVFFLFYCNAQIHTRRSDLKTGISFKIGHISGGRLTSPPCDRFAGVALLCKWRKKSLPLYGTGRIGRMFRLRNFVRTFECACVCVSIG